MPNWIGRKLFAVLPSDVKPGDILFLLDTPDNTSVKHLGIKLGQKLTSLNVGRQNMGRADFVHALIFIGLGAVAEASGEAGEVRAIGLNQRHGIYRVYTCTNDALGKRASEAALNWSVLGGMGYAKRKAVMSIFHSDDLAKCGKSRALAYANQINAAKPNFGRGRAFCSEFVIACYQAAAIDLAPGGSGTSALQGPVLECDAKHCSVRAFHDRLVRDSQFKWMGTLQLARDIGLSIPVTA